MLEFSLKKIRLANYMLIILVVVSALLLARNIVNISFSSKSAALTEKINLNTPVFKKARLMHYAAVLENNPFGRPLQFRPLGVSRSTEKQFNSLSGLILVGTVTGPKHLSYAVFEDTSQSPSGSQEVFRYGDMVFNYGILKKIGPSSVEIQQDSATYTVTISFESLTSGSEPSPSARTTTAPATFAKKVGERKYLLNSRIVQESLKNPEHILTDARLLPNFKDGKQEGFSISEVIPDGLYHNLGLRNGDVLLKINDLKISNPEVAIQAMSAMRGMNRINLDIVRDGKKMSMNYQIR
jgi:general secretion pathway protein C